MSLANIKSGARLRLSYDTVIVTMIIDAIPGIKNMED